MGWLPSTTFALRITRSHVRDYVRCLSKKQLRQILTNHGTTFPSCFCSITDMMPSGPRGLFWEKSSLVALFSVISDSIFTNDWGRSPSLAEKKAECHQKILSKRRWDPLLAGHNLTESGGIDILTILQSGLDIWKVLYDYQYLRL